MHFFFLPKFLLESIWCTNRKGSRTIDTFCRQLAPTIRPSSQQCIAICKWLCFFLPFRCPQLFIFWHAPKFLHKLKSKKRKQIILPTLKNMWKWAIACHKQFHFSKKYESYLLALKKKWWLWVRYPVAANFHSGVFSPLTSEHVRKGVGDFGKKGVLVLVWESQEAHMHHRPPWCDLSSSNGA